MIKFGVAGYPPAYKDTIYRKDRMKIFQWLTDLNLDAFEMQMTYGPRTTLENCKELKKLSIDYNIKLSIHGSYFIVFTSSEPKKISQSIDTLKRTYELADVLGSDIVVLHPGPLYGRPANEIINIFKENASKFFSELGQASIGLFLETAGKRGQLGSVEEIFDLCASVKGCYPCVDFGHVHARTGGTLGNEDAINKFFDELSILNFFETFKRYHFHYTPIHYGPKGEITHKALEDTYDLPAQMELGLFESKPNKLYHPRYDGIIKNLLKQQIECTVISETHNSQERGALAMKRFYNEIKNSSIYLKHQVV